ncbi:hypothetical protein R6U77_00935 [Lysinibacillus louembei]|uniref:Uncharacterized protein n=1 Tax=Lysinibacillus louembei TaxID=1470088 RepID=A0ABZ0RXZ5_9BACI|nr:hypothetical protein [Lysinibacillus louembei]WPK12284.1 hypothetical protein R6U77_00935 [Lysinibacillus louembei]
MKPAVRLAQIELDTPNWQSNPALVAEVKKLRELIGYGKHDFAPRKDMYRYTVYRDGQLVFEGSAKEVTSYLNLATPTVRNRAAYGHTGVKGTMKGIRIARIDLRKLEIVGEADEVV